MACPGFNLPAVKACPAYATCLDRGGDAAICRRCYAQKGRYKWQNVKLAIDRRWDWWLATPPLTRARELAKAVRSEGSPMYFRAYDSGDVCHSAEDTWLKFVELLPEVKVWIPTRTWCLGEKSAKGLRKMNQHPRLFVRPSALAFGDTPPEIKGLSAGATARLSKEIPVGLADRVCPGQCGECRCCWSKDLTVAYPRK